MIDVPATDVAAIDVDESDAAAIDVAAEAHRGPGRPRSTELDRSIRRAAIDLLAEEGYGGLTMEGVAARAACGKATIYRRWPSKSALVIEAINVCCTESAPIPDTGSARGDLLAFISSMVTVMRESDAGRVMPALVAELPRSPELAETFRLHFVQPRRALLIDRLQRGVDRGELRPEADLELVADASVALLQHRLLVTGMTIDVGLPGRIVDLLWRGVASGS